MNDPLERLLIGRSLVGRYSVEEVIGRGGMSIVYRARDERLGRHVALKILRFPADIAAGEREHLRERLKREAAAAARIPPHPNVVQIYDYGTDDELDLDFIAMELLQGRDLKERLRAGRMEPGEARRVLIEAARGVAAGHRAGLVHRDVKPANVFLTGDHDLEVVKILDFGIAKAFSPGADDDEFTRDGRIPHSPAYTSPEQLDVSRPVTPASDVYQLGLLAYEMLAGERPYTEEQRDRIRAGERVALESRGRWSEVPEPVRAAVSQALEPDPHDRFADAALFAAGVDQRPEADLPTATNAVAEDDDDATLFGPPPPPATQHPHVRDLRRTAVAAAAVASLALIVWAAVGALTSADGVESALEPTVDADAAEPAADTEALDEEFRQLLGEAFENLQEAVSAEEGEEAAAAIQEVIGGIQQSWVQGDIDRHVDYYAAEVDFRGDDEADRERIAEVRRESIDRYPERQIWIDGFAVRFEGPGRARALVNRRWRFEGDDVWEGVARDEMVLVKEGESWKVVSEAELETFAGDPEA